MNVQSGGVSSCSSLIGVAMSEVAASVFGGKRGARILDDVMCD